MTLTTWGTPMPLLKHRSHLLTLSNIGSLAAIQLAIDTLETPSLTIPLRHQAIEHAQ